MIKLRRKITTSITNTENLFYNPHGKRLFPILKNSQSKIAIDILDEYSFNY